MDNDDFCANAPICSLPDGWVAPARGLADLKARFGDIQIRAGAIGPPGWEAHSMHTVTDLPGWPRRLYLNNAIEAPLRMALSRCVGLIDGYVVRTLGCFAPRPKRVNGDLSVHSWGLAVDLNAAQNQLVDAPRSPPACGEADEHGRVLRDIPDAWVAAFEAVGWTWGGRFRRPDPMHFQWCSGY